jgi:hypothetical protein
VLRLLDRREKRRQGIFDTGTKKLRLLRSTIPSGMNPIEED